MFDNIEGPEKAAVDEKLRQNLQKFNRDSLRILHPVFVDALRLLARRDHPDRTDTLLLPLAWPGAASASGAGAARTDYYPPTGQDPFQMVRLHGSV
ncbi:hypothetical protein [Breoghania sp. L-A4]|uniref:hypothetical protein n=1 Tax=Breoghania sp. L-A4 TaxID=2304600 RepID=UPI0013C2CAAF|nr:hypothetical protein [Breoghania sp. L-A4]